MKSDPKTYSNAYVNFWVALSMTAALFMSLLVHPTTVMYFFGSTALITVFWGVRLLREHLKP